MQLEVITPESNLFSGEAVAIQLPGVDGLFQILNGHAPIISTLKEGIVKIDLPEALKSTKKIHQRVQVDAAKKSLSITIEGGVIEMVNNKLILLAE